MGRVDKKIFYLIVLSVFSFLADSSVYGEDSGTVATFDTYLMPEYNKKTGELQFILYGKKAESSGAIVDMDYVLVDIVRENISDMRDLQDYTGLKIYKIGQEQDKIREFWNGKEHTRVIVETIKAKYNRTTKLVRGNDKVHFRSREMDIDGVGFDIDYPNKLINIHSNVKVVIRRGTTESSKDSGGEKTETASPATEKKIIREEVSDDSRE